MLEVNHGRDHAFGTFHGESGSGLSAPSVSNLLKAVLRTLMLCALGAGWTSNQAAAQVSSNGQSAIAAAMMYVDSTIEGDLLFVPRIYCPGIDPYPCDDADWGPEVLGLAQDVLHAQLLPSPAGAASEPGRKVEIAFSSPVELENGRISIAVHITRSWYWIIELTLAVSDGEWIVVHQATVGVS